MSISMPSRKMSTKLFWDLARIFEGCFCHLSRLYTLRSFHLRTTSFTTRITIFTYAPTAMQSLLSISLFILVVSAQFQFFDQFFGGQQQQQGQQEKQNVASDSSWFQGNWQQGKLLGILC